MQLSAYSILIMLISVCTSHYGAIILYQILCCQVTKAEYQHVGSEALGEQLAKELREQGRNPYVIPVGGSNSLGTWGYLQCVSELQEQIEGEGFTDIVMVSQSLGKLIRFKRTLRSGCTSQRAPEVLHSHFMAMLAGLENPTSLICHPNESLLCPAFE